MTEKNVAFKLTPRDAREAVADALESGKYIQGREALRNGDEFCCLGVACDIFMKAEGLGHWEMTTHDLDAFVLRKTPERTHLPVRVADWLGFRTIQGEHSGGGSLVKDNDNGVSFKKIAKKFRNPPEGLID